MALSTELHPERLQLDRLLLDPNNPRLIGVTGSLSDALPDSVAADSEVQAELQLRLKREMGLESLIEKIKANGFLPIDRIVVRPASGSDGKYVVLEGNRRVASLRIVKADAIALAEMDDDRKNTLSELDVLVYDGSDPMISWSIQGLRHIEGVREWGPFQRAAFLSSLSERHDMPVSKIAKLAGLRPNVSNKLVRAYRGLRQAQEDPDWGEEVGEEDFAIFHEAVFAKNHSELWKWLNWDDTKGRFDAEENLSVLLSLVKDDENGDGRPVIQRVNPDLRDHFQKILAEPESDRLVEQLRSKESSLSQLTQQLTQDHVRDDLADVEQALERLRNLANAADLLPTPGIVETGKIDEVLKILDTIAKVISVQKRALAGAVSAEAATSVSDDG